MVFVREALGRQRPSAARAGKEFLFGARRPRWFSGAHLASPAVLCSVPQARAVQGHSPTPWPLQTSKYDLSRCILE